MAPPRSNPLADTTNEHGDRLAELERRVARLENLTGTRVRTQEEDDAEILARQPNSYAEAVRYEAALERQKARKNRGQAPADAKDD